ncbi:MAG TPA: SGNH/GDSL hydrolase family protein [Armatimonadota bacterium]|nr:SGNH/GDSL hydrolase family protein [Armatimonadota bacterium]
MKVVLCYGDSNTWGYDPATKKRFAPDVRWTGVTQAQLGDGYRVIEEGLNGRTTVWDDPIEGYKNGKEQIIPCIESHKPIDLVIIGLGVNDLKQRFSVPAWDIAASAGKLVEIVQKSATGPDDSAPAVLLLCPAKVGKLSEFADMFGGAVEKSAQLADQYERVAGEYDCPWFDIGAVATSSDLDGIHFEAGEHRKIGEAIAARVKAILE